MSRRETPKQHHARIMARGRVGGEPLSGYPEIPGMEGPFRMRSGRIVYWDPREGKYYDRSADMYLTQREADALDRTGRQAQDALMKALRRGK